MTSDGQQPPPLPEPDRQGGAPQSGDQQYGRQPGPAGQPAGYPVQPYQPYGGQPYAGQPYAGQPQPGWGPPAGPPPDNYLVWAILSTIMCCLPLGIVSIVYAAQVNDKWARGDVAGAMESSQKAKQFATWSAIATVAVYVVLALVYGVILVFAIGAGVATSSS